MARISKPPPTTVGQMVDWMTRRFDRARLAYGHGTTTAADEAAFIVLETLGLPIDRLEAYRAMRLTDGEQYKLMGLGQRRVRERLPAPYLLGAAYMQGVRFRSDRRALVPRSFIGDLLAPYIQGGGGVLPVADPLGVTRVLDLCTGSGCLAILAALAFPHAQVDAVDLSKDALALARRNVADHRLRERIEILRGDLFAPAKGRRYDLIISNPPYVDADGMRGLPREFRHEPRLGLAAGKDGLDLVRRILADAPAHLTTGGGLICEVGRGRANLEAACPGLPFLWLDTELSEGEMFWLDRSSI